MRKAAPPDNVETSVPYPTVSAFCSSATMSAPISLVVDMPAARLGNKLGLIIAGSSFLYVCVTGLPDDLANKLLAGLNAPIGGCLQNG